MRASVRALARSWRRLQGNAVIAAHLPGQRRVPFLPRDRLEALRDRRIRRLVAYASDTVPYYRERFAQIAVDPRESTGARDLDRLPCRQGLGASPEFRGEERARRGLSLRTSGSTGARSRPSRRRSLSQRRFRGARATSVTVRWGCSARGA